MQHPNDFFREYTGHFNTTCCFVYHRLISTKQSFNRIFFIDYNVYLNTIKKRQYITLLKYKNRNTKDRMQLHRRFEDSIYSWQTRRLLFCKATPDAGCISRRLRNGGNQRRGQRVSRTTLRDCGRRGSTGTEQLATGVFYSSLTCPPVALHI